ncbi:MAG: hypothetical protein WD185_07945 [Sneathiella sp.]
MYARIEKVGNAQELQHGPALGTLFDTVSRFQHFAVSTVRKHLRLAKEKAAVVVDLTKGPLSIAINDGIGITGKAANENCLHPTT